MSKKQGYETAVQVAVDKLMKVNISRRVESLDLPMPQKGFLNIRAFGRNMNLNLSDFQMEYSNSADSVKVSDKILVLHYLLCDLPIPEKKDLISFRQMEGGAFYWDAFAARSTQPLVQRIGNNLSLLEKNIKRFDWQPVSMGDFAARIHAIGKVYVTLIYRLGDEEFPASADILFDDSIRRIFCTEDVAALSSRICLGLL